MQKRAQTETVRFCIALLFTAFSAIVCLFLYIFTTIPGRWARTKAMHTVAYLLYLPSRMAGVTPQTLRTPNKRSIIVTHHCTALECAILYHTLHPCAILKRELLFTPFLGAICASTERVIWLDRTKFNQRATLQKTAQHKGEHLLIFSEGTRTSFHAPVQSKSLVYFIAKQHEDTPVVPLVHNSHIAFSAHSAIPHTIKNVTYSFLDPIEDDRSRGRRFLDKIDSALDAGKATLPNLGAPFGALSVHMLHTYIQQKVPVCVIDVRTHQELATAKLPFAHHVLPELLEDFCTTYLDTAPRSTVFALLCHHGVRTAPITTLLRNKGINACNILGGINAWSTHIDPSIPKY